MGSPQTRVEAADPRADARLRRFAGALREHFHARRAHLFRTLLRPDAATSILDLGGSDGEFMARLDGLDSSRITVADIGEGPLVAERERGFRGVRLTEGEPLPFADGEFDVVFCNSVIEHVTLPKADCLRRGYVRREWRQRSLHQQAAFAREIRRVGRAYFVQTPHRHFPIEAHTWLPGANWLSHRSARRLVRLTDRFWVKYCGVADWHLLGAREMRALFPDAALRVERVFGLPKSLIAYKPRSR